MRQITKKFEQVHIAMFSQIEPENFEEESKDKSWIDAMNEVLDKIEKNKTLE